MTKPAISLGIILQGAGAHMNAWKHPRGPADASVNFDFYLETTRKAEAAGMAFAFVADGLYVTENSLPHFLNRFEPVSILSALAAATSKIGLVGTISTSYSQPFTIARQIGSIDVISGGRAGWNAVTSPLEGSARNFGGAHPEHGLRYEIADEYIEVIRKLWNSWDDKAFPRDRENGVFADWTKARPANHHGRFFSVDGPLNIQSSPQGEPVIFQAGASPAGINLAGKHADAVFTDADTLEDGQAFYRAIKQSAQLHGRDAGAIKIFPGIEPIVGITEAEAEAKYQAIRNLVTIEEALTYLGRYFDHHDFSQYPLDEPFPEIGDIGRNSFRSTTDRIKSRARETGQSLRDVALSVTTPRTPFIGTREKVAEEMLRWVDEGAADGFILGFPVIAEGLDDFIRYVIPVLSRLGRYDQNPQGDTLRQRLGLPLPIFPVTLPRTSVPENTASTT